MSLKTLKVGDFDSLEAFNELARAEYDESMAILTPVSVSLSWAMRGSKSYEIYYTLE